MAVVATTPLASGITTSLFVNSVSSYVLRLPTTPLIFGRGSTWRMRPRPHHRVEWLQASSSDVLPVPLPSARPSRIPTSQRSRIADTRSSPRSGRPTSLRRATSRGVSVSHFDTGVDFGAIDVDQAAAAGLRCRYPPKHTSRSSERGCELASQTMQACKYRISRGLDPIRHSS